MITDLDKDRIEAAVAQAEAGTGGEIICVLASEVSHYPEIPIAWGAAAALALPPLALALGLRPLAAASSAGLWLVAQASEVETQLAWAIGAYAALQLLLFVAVTAVVSIPPVRRFLTPGRLKSHRVARAARHHFAAVGAHGGAARAGVLLFVAIDDCKVEVIADPELHRKADQATWAKAAAAIAAAMKAGTDPTAGILEAIALCGAALKAHAPGPATAPHPDRPVEI